MPKVIYSTAKTIEKQKVEQGICDLLDLRNWLEMKSFLFRIKRDFLPKLYFEHYVQIL